MRRIQYDRSKKMRATPTWGASSRELPDAERHETIEKYSLKTSATQEFILFISLAREVLEVWGCNCIFRHIFGLKSLAMWGCAKPRVRGWSLMLNGQGFVTPVFSHQSFNSGGRWRGGRKEKKKKTTSPWTLPSPGKLCRGCTEPRREERSTQRKKEMRAKKERGR